MLRYSLCLLFFWFGAQQLLDPVFWSSFLPNFTDSWPVQSETIVRLNGSWEIIFALLLLLGFYTRLVAFILGLHLLGIAYTLGGSVGMRDLALALSSFSLALSAADHWTWDFFRLSKKREQILS